MQTIKYRQVLHGTLLGGLVLGGLMASAWALERETLLIKGRGQVHQLFVEIARTPRERTFGLMERDHLAANAGMLFTYSREQSPHSGYWMYRTRIPLDIAFLGEKGEIRAIHSMSPCPSKRPVKCPPYPAGVPYHAALEVNAGYFDERGIHVGDRVERP